MTSVEVPKKNCLTCPAFAQSAFSLLTETQLQTLEQHKQTAQYEAGQVFTRQGQCANTVLCLGLGAAKVVLQSSDPSKSSLVRLARPGDFIGYRCVFSETAFRATASALENSMACAVNKDLFISFIKENPAFALELLQRMGREIAAAERRHDSFCQKTSRERIAEGLVILGEKFGTHDAAGLHIGVYLSRVEFAQWVGVAKETLSRCLSDFVDEGLIELEPRNIVILKLEELHRAASLHEDRALKKRYTDLPANA